MSDVKTICPYCGTGCGMRVHVQGTRITGIHGLPGSPVNEGELCLKCYFGYFHTSDRHRLVSPLRREGSHFVKISWDTALDEIAGRLKAIKEKHGPDSFMMFSSARSTNEDNYAAQKFTRTAMGTNNVDHCSRL
jgi:formate dehydrogenase major subunit